MILEGRSAIVTGASQGLGAAIAQAYAAAGASLMLCARDADAVGAVADRLRGSTRPGQVIEGRRCDVSRPEEVDALVEAALARFGQVDVLVNNAGVYGPKGRLEDTDWRAWTEALAVNVGGTVYPCRAVLPAMRRRRYGKIVNLSGGGATTPLPRLTAYAASKAAVVRFTESLALDVRDDGIDVNAVAPGALATRLLDEVIEAGPDAVGADFHARMIETRATGGTPLDVGAALCVWLGSAASDGITGRLLSALWDPWRTLSEHRAALDQSDVYTLRRIVPADRGQDWAAA